MRSDCGLVRFITPLFACRLLVTVLALPATGQAQSLNLASGAKDQPIEIIADNGIEWQQENEILIASGNAKASRDGISVEAEVIRAYYKQKPEGGADLYRLDAVGGVVLGLGVITWSALKVSMSSFMRRRKSPSVMTPKI